MFNLKQIITRALRNGATHFVVGVVIIKDGSVLIVRRVPNDFLGGYYELPGGGVENNETLEEAVIRETFEETGLTVSRISAAYDGFDYTHDDKKVKQINFLIDVTNHDVKLNPDEHDSFVWVSLEELKKYPMTKEIKKTIAEIFTKGVIKIGE